MGGAPSTVQNNGELVEYLLHNHYVHKKEVELVFRAVDRADYVLPSHQESAYNDLAWKHGNLHLSAPCVYAVAMEFLSLKPGQSFLNIGSGTGYFSTMAGFLLGPYGINHGIELHEDCIGYARDRLENFKLTSHALEEFEFCEPSFVQGNCLRVKPTREYDTVYCGAAVSENNLAAVKRFVRVGGRIVMPYKGRLCCFKRLTETVWSSKKSLGVSFATLVTPDAADQHSISLPESEPLSLQEFCRIKVRQILRENIWAEHPELEKCNLSLPSCQSRTDTLFDHSDDWLSNDDEDDDDDEEEDEDEEDDVEEDDDEDEDETDGHIIRRTRFLFNMEVDPNEMTSNPLPFRRVAMLVRQTIDAEQQRAEALLDAIIEERGNTGPPTAARSAGSSEQDVTPGTAENQSMDASPNNVLDLSLNEPQEWGDSRGNRANESSTRDSDSDGESECDRESECDSEDERPSQWMKLTKRENTDSGIVEDLNDTSSSLNVDHSDSEAENGMDIDLSSGAFREAIRRACAGADDLSPSSPSSETVAQTTIFDVVDSRLFVEYMKEKIQLLPLPTKLKLYIFANRSCK